MRKFIYGCIASIDLIVLFSLQIVAILPLPLLPPVERKLFEHDRRGVVTIEGEEISITHIDTTERNFSARGRLIDGVYRVQWAHAGMDYGVGYYRLTEIGLIGEYYFADRSNAKIIDNYKSAAK